MRRFVLIACLLAAAAATAVSAGAATPTTFTLTAGGLSISAPTGSVSLGSQPVSNSSFTITGSLGVVTVSDQRGGVTTWTATVISTAFTPPSGPADPAANVSYAAGTITQSGVVAAAVAAADLTGVTPVVNWRERRDQQRQLEPHHLRARACQLRPGRLLGHDHALGRLTVA
jgi:hypothetical protein